MAKQIRKCDFCLSEYIPDKRNIKRGWGLCCSKSCAGNKRELDKMGFIPSDLIQIQGSGGYFRMECISNNVGINYIIYFTEIDAEVETSGKNNTYSSKIDYNNPSSYIGHPQWRTDAIKPGIISLIKNNMNSNDDYVIKTIDKFLSKHSEYKIELI